MRVEVVFVEEVEEAVEGLAEGGAFDDGVGVFRVI